MNEDGTEASKTSESNLVMLGGDILLKPVGGIYLVEWEQAKEEGETKEREVKLNEDLMVMIENNEQINDEEVQEDDEGVKVNDEEDRWSNLDPLWDWMMVVKQPKISIKDLKADNRWNERLLEDLVGRDQA
ncbi:Hypothetical predicted protein [Olea europaea subsp. europaea]|uniref:Uncharacterized protein n=1 Tax=Olea europaea subsp. europaea TaxID=158383 RepID=A0A8S0VF82_OLEEU|nr:Hypothetical predicted protein [Olea europaea subsp. europaea]